MLAAMKEIINPVVLVGLDVAKKELMLKEDGADSKISKLYITNMPDNAIAFTLDHQPGRRDNHRFKQLSFYVDPCNDKGVNKGCDLIVFWHEAGIHTALVFDLKSDKPKVGATQKQLDNSELYLKYLLSMVSTHYGIATDQVVIKKVIIPSTGQATLVGGVAFDGKTVFTRVQLMALYEATDRPSSGIWSAIG